MVIYGIKVGVDFSISTNSINADPEIVKLCEQENFRKGFKLAETSGSQFNDLHDILRIFRFICDTRDFNQTLPVEQISSKQNYQLDSLRISSTIYVKVKKIIMNELIIIGINYQRVRIRSAEYGEPHRALIIIEAHANLKPSLKSQTFQCGAPLEGTNH